ncbi:MAG: PEP-CTERM sorting domain-containing protein [Phycisphaerae bacterium]|nr:PEP-CTERM sorting domain-containing protein [Phycisphaerae bacterium]
MKKSILILAAVLFAVTGLAQAAHMDATFVNATVNNTVAANGDAEWLGLEADYGHGQPLWRDRDAVVGVFGVFTADESWDAGSDYLTLKTTITGLNAGQAYNVYLDFCGNTGNWSIMGGLSESTIEGFAGTSKTIGANYHIGTDDASGRVVATGGVTTSGNYALHRALLGETTANANGEIAVFVDDSDNVGVRDTYRVWYDGVAYEAVPEPATMSLLGIGVLALIRRKK